MTSSSYRIDVAPSAVRQLRKLDPSARRRIQAAVELLAEEPRPAGAKKLVGGDGEWRVRTGDFRIVYEIHDQVLLVLVVRGAGPVPTSVQSHVLARFATLSSAASRGLCTFVGTPGQVRPTGKQCVRGSRAPRLVR